MTKKIFEGPCLSETDLLLPATQWSKIKLEDMSQDDFNWYQEWLKIEEHLPAQAYVYGGQIPTMRYAHYMGWKAGHQQKTSILTVDVSIKDTEEFQVLLTGLREMYGSSETPEAVKVKIAKIVGQSLDQHCDIKCDSIKVPDDLSIKIHEMCLSVQMEVSKLLDKIDEIQDGVAELYLRLPAKPERKERIAL